MLLCRVYSDIQLMCCGHSNTLADSVPALGFPSHLPGGLSSTANAELAMSWSRSGSHGTTVRLLLCLDLTKGQPSCSSIAWWNLLPQRRWGGLVRETLPEPSLPEVNFFCLVFPQMSYFRCSTWDCSGGPDFLKVLSALLQKHHPSRNEKLKVVRVL